MPSVRVHVVREIADQVEEQDMVSLLDQLRMQVATVFGFDVSEVEAMWMPLEHSRNTCSINVDVMYSISDAFCPNKDTKNSVIDRVLGLMTAASSLPKGIEISCWMLPQRDAIYKTAKR